MSVYSWTLSRERGDLRRKVSPSTSALVLQRKLWNSLYRKPEETDKNSQLGNRGVFGLKYSPDGSYLVAARENDAVAVIDPLTSKIVKTRERVHTKRCNTITFIDNRLFATCSDDSNISIWDIRNLSEEVLQLRGHRGWVKNVEYHKPTKCLVSAGFDDQVLLWDFNNPTSSGQCEASLLLTCANLMRMKLSPDGKSMYMSTMQTADLIAIRNLDLANLFKDVESIHCVGQYGTHSIAFENQQISVDRFDRFDNQSRPIFRQNSLELYYGYHAEDKGSCTVFCQSIDVHPENMALALRYDRRSSYIAKFTSVHNTWSYYNGRHQGNNSWLPDDCTDETYLPMPRGIATNFAQEDRTENVEYIQEICFSPCGRLLASPFGYGVRLMSVDKNLSDYRTHIASKVAATHQWAEGSDKVMPSFQDIEPTELHDVTYCFGHRSLVLSTCFSPIHMQVATGSKNGQVILYDPVL